MGGLTESKCHTHSLYIRLEFWPDLVSHWDAFNKIALIEFFLFLTSRIIAYLHQNPARLYKNLIKIA